MDKTKPKNKEEPVTVPFEDKLHKVIWYHLSHILEKYGAILIPIMGKYCMSIETNFTTKGMEYWKDPEHIKALEEEYNTITKVE